MLRLLPDFNLNHDLLEAQLHKVNLGIHLSSQYLNEESSALKQTLFRMQVTNQTVLLILGKTMAVVDLDDESNSRGKHNIILSAFPEKRMIQVVQCRLKNFEVIGPYFTQNWSSKTYEILEHGVNFLHNQTCEDFYFHEHLSRSIKPLSLFALLNLNHLDFTYSLTVSEEITEFSDNGGTSSFSNFIRTENERLSNQEITHTFK